MIEDIINWNNLKSMFNYILEVPENLLSMDTYRKKEWTFITNKKGNTINKYIPHKCGTVGCIIGHCIFLDKLENIPKGFNGQFHYYAWSQQFTGINNRIYWCFIFGENWASNEQTNSKKQILARMQFFIDNKKVPDAFYKNKISFNYSIIIEQYNKNTPYEIN